MAYDTGGGGGVATTLIESTRFSYSKPYDLVGEATPESLQQINEMLRELYTAANRTDDAGLKVTGTVTDGNLVVFDGATGTQVRDGGATTGAILVSHTVITDAQMKLLLTTPIELIAAPGAGKVIDIIANRWSCNITANGSVSVTGTIRLNTINVTLVTAGTMISAGSNGERETKSALTTFNTMGTAHTNRAVEIVGSANAGAAFASVDGFHITLVYHITDDPN